ncbi:hypothetical protein AUC43_08550 [Hymenobacter sedentarius]|uniref:Uncharacterized protein n=1 Tax=Hymenobacter sedentarius TaxID=1411621 RepID=A0A0U4BY13_9BACT|nr:DUF5996 family protein [Hymenobacter sedentarius]ALW85137.1 hypothetical protein AUC43_08550 [Hymenobacter sedentarius]
MARKLPSTATPTPATLPYEAARRVANPPAAVLDFLQTTYAAAADLMCWDRPALERATVPDPAS